MKRRSQPIDKMTWSKDSPTLNGFTFRTRNAPNNYLKKISSILKENTTVHLNRPEPRGHPKREQPKSKRHDSHTDMHTSLEYLNTVPIKDEKVRMTHLMNQNIFLMNQLMIQRYKEEDYLTAIKSLQESKSDQTLSFTRTNEKYVKIKKLSTSIQSLAEELTQLIKQSEVEGFSTKRNHKSEMMFSLTSLEPQKRYVSEEVL